MTEEIKWYIVKVPCTDGKERVGMLQDGVLDIEDHSRILKSGLHEEYAQAIISMIADEQGLEMFDGLSEKYDADTI